MKKKFLPKLNASVDKQNILTEVLYPMVKDNILYHDHRDCEASRNQVKVLPQEVPTSDGLIGQRFTWNMIREEPFQSAWEKC